MGIASICLMVVLLQAMPAGLTCPYRDYSRLDDLRLMPQASPVRAIQSHPQSRVEMAARMREIGSPMTAGYLFAALYLFGNRTDKHIATRGTLACIASSAITLGLKRLIGRARPTQDGPHGRLHGLSSHYDSFPSGHTAIAFTVAAVYARERPESAAYVYPLAGAVGWSRVYLKAHWPEDVLAGALVGYLVGSG